MRISVFKRKKTPKKMPQKPSSVVLRGGKACVLTASVLQSADGVGQQPRTAQEASSLLLVNLLVVPHADGDRIRLPNIPANVQGPF